MKNLFYLITVILFLTSCYNIVKMQYMHAVYFLISGVLSLIVTEKLNYDLIKRFWRMKILSKFTAIIPIGHILGILFIISLTSCGDDKYNIQLKDGSIVEATNNINTYKYKVGDTVCISYSNAWGKWYFEDFMKDTTMYYGGHYRYSKTKKDSVYVPLMSTKTRIGVIK